MKGFRLFAVVASLALVGACGDDDGGDRPDARPLPDAPPSIDAAPPADAAPEVCSVDTAGYGMQMPTDTQQQAQYASDGMGGSDMNTVLYRAAMNGDQDQLDLQLYANFGMSTYNGMPGTYMIAGEELNYATCGVCVRIFSDVTMTGYAQMFMATSGTVVLEEIGPNLRGHIDMTSLEHVTGGTMAENYVTTPAADAATCNTTITRIDFNTPINPAM